MVEELVPKLLSLAVVQKVIQNLMRERVSIQDRAMILEALDGAAPITKNTVLLTEYVQQAIRRQVVRATAYFLDPAVEQAIEPAVEHSEILESFNPPPQRNSFEFDGALAQRSASRNQNRFARDGELKRWSDN